MRILLVSPESKVWNSRAHIHMGLGYLAGSLLAHGYEVALYDGVVESEPLAALLEREHFDVVGISSPTPLINEAWQAAAAAKTHEAVTILGGPHLTIMPAESMQKPQVDLVVRGEAETTIVEILRALEKAPPVRITHHASRITPGSVSLFDEEIWGKIPGLSFRNRHGEVVHNPNRPLVEDLDSIPLPAHHLFQIERYTNLNPLTDGLDPKARAYTIVTSRGCPYKCIYCCKPITGHTWRARSVENVIAEWRWLVRDLRATEIGVTDDIWNLDLKRAKAICRALIDEKLNTVPWITIHGMKVTSTDQELFDLMKEAGCKRVGFGVESGDDWILNQVIKKGQTVETARRAFAQAKKAGLQTMGFFIFGIPGETEETMEKTIRLALELEPDLAHFMMAVPYPGTEMWETLERAGSIAIQDWGELAIQDDKAHFSYGGLEKETVERKWHEAHRRFYLRPSRLVKVLWRKDTWRRAPYYLDTARRFLLGEKERAAN
jgi:anaerobic magnesium-protoporphyrin IX monomethyl ester cyclase